MRKTEEGKMKREEERKVGEVNLRRTHTAEKK